MAGKKLETHRCLTGGRAVEDGFLKNTEVNDHQHKTFSFMDNNNWFDR